MNKSKTDLLTAHAKYIKAQDEMYEKLDVFNQECDDELSKLLKRYGFKGVFRPNSMNFRGGILVRSWQLGTYMVHDYEIREKKKFLIALEKAAFQFYRKLGIKIIIRSNGNWLTLPE